MQLIYTISCHIELKILGFLWPIVFGLGVIDKHTYCFSVGYGFVASANIVYAKQCSEMILSHLSRHKPLGHKISHGWANSYNNSITRYPSTSISDYWKHGECRKSKSLSPRMRQSILSSVAHLGGSGNPVTT